MTQGRDDKQLMRNELLGMCLTLQIALIRLSLCHLIKTITKMLTKNQRCKNSDEHLKTQ